MLKKLSGINKVVNQKIGRRLKFLVLIAFLLLFWALLSKSIFSLLITSSSSNIQILNEKDDEKINYFKNLFSGYQNQTLGEANQIYNNKEVRKSLQTGENRKVFEELLKIKGAPTYQVEIYNKKLELIAFQGRDVQPKISSLQKALAGKNFSILKEVNFYTYLVLFNPIRDITDTNTILGVSVTSRLIDIEYQIKNDLLNYTGLSAEIQDKFKTTPEIIISDEISGVLTVDSTKLKTYAYCDIKGIDGNTIGEFLIPKYTSDNYSYDITSLDNKISSLTIFFFSILLLLIVLTFLERVSPVWAKGIILFAAMLLVRYVWVYINFPSALFEYEIFSPSSYASTFGFGIVKSTGDLFISSLFTVILSLYVFKSIFKNYFSSEGNGIQFSAGVFKTIIESAVYFLMLYMLGLVIQSVVFDSNLKFLDKTNLVPDASLIFIQISLFLCGITAFTFLTLLILDSFHNFIKRDLIRNKYVRKYFFLIFFLIYLGLNQLVEIFYPDFPLTFYHRLVITSLIFLFCFFLSRNLFLKRDFKILSYTNISFLVLISLISIPYILLDKLTAQETKFVELIGTKLAENENDKILFLISSELNSISDNKEVELSLTNKDKLSKLAFSLWTESKLSSENLNSAILLLDTNFNLISDFNINYASLNIDSVITSVKKSVTAKNPPVSLDSMNTIDSAITEEPEYTGGGLEEFLKAPEEDTLKTNSSYILFKNPENKFYAGVSTLEKIDLRETEYAKKTGYAVIAVQYEPKNLLIQSSFQIFKNYTKDNILDKLISTPVITEYIDEEVVSSTAPDISKGNLKSLTAFKSSIRNKENKSSWRYEAFNNENYRTFYILADDPESQSEKIYSISIKRNDIYLILFFYLKFVLFIVMIYGLLSFMYFLYYVSSRKLIVFNFREKLLTSFIIVSVIPIILLAIYTRSFIKSKYDIAFENQIKSDLNLISENFKNGNMAIFSDKIADSLKKKEKAVLTKNLTRADKNFNLYLGSSLLSTTNEELFKSDLLDERLDGSAYFNLNYDKKDVYFKNLELPGYSFYVGYKPILDKNNNLKAVISSQTVYRQNEINEELTESLTFIFGIYIIVIIILLLFITIFVERITRPISILKLATDKLSRGESNIEIMLDRKDEFGSLVESFNRMTRELEASKEKLKRAEREATWRDIARRVAHEIKNPLTPMKLSIQHLYDLYLNKKSEEKFEGTLTKTKNIMLNEIDKLNKIATEFSNFVKLPERKYVKVDINEVINDVVSLYEKSPGITFEISLKENLSIVTADKQEMNRVFQNIIKNSVQAIYTEGIIKIVSQETDLYVTIIVEDNGEGMDNDTMKNLFEPNFSTKSSGMGLGLSITKKSLDSMEAHINYQSEKGKGTKVTMQFSKKFNGV